ncbi:hypothetical protein QVD17_02433 [Tagetes erecta]|uniref:Uncharacterized protein n=1 Tax=Tagetes erecta TaxID=13708 RepID=A0AAD8P953_TARER|nr:hypothetical protein QVD17_02433 [Tagetes erecta]
MHSISVLRSNVAFSNRKNVPDLWPNHGCLFHYVSFFHGALDGVNQGMEKAPHRGYHPNLEDICLLACYLLLKGKGPLQEKLARTPPQSICMCISPTYGYQKSLISWRISTSFWLMEKSQKNNNFFLKKNQKKKKTIKTS